MENRLFRRTVLTLLALLSTTFAPTTARTGNDAANVASAVNDTPFHGTWIDSATSLWALSLQPRFAALDASFWEYDRWKVQEERATVRLKSTNGTRRTLRLELANDSTLLWDDDGTLRTLLRESPTVAQRPFATPPDTTSFACGPWVNDSILIEGFVIDYQHGVTHFNYRFQFLLPDNNSGSEQRPFPLDSLGRFRFTVPVHYEKLHLLGNYVVAGPGDHLFIAIHTRDRNLFMGDNARINQELDRYNPSQYADQFMPSPRANERISELSSWRFGQLSTLRVALRTIADFCAQHQLSRKTQQVYNSFAKYATLQKLISMPEMSGIICPYTYYLPDEHLDYSDPELLLWADNQALLMPFTRLHSRYQPINMADRLGLQGDDRITFLNFGYMYQLDPTLLTSSVRAPYPVSIPSCRRNPSTLRLPCNGQAPSPTVCSPLPVPTATTCSLRDSDCSGASPRCRSRIRPSTSSATNSPTAPSCATRCSNATPATAGSPNKTPRCRFRPGPSATPSSRPTPSSVPCSATAPTARPVCSFCNPSTTPSR